ncbi:MAG TPA: hypothetical protein ENF52_01890 [Chloroflexi bacterium]|nr:hypothetical protein [Chloroflexota bacterium]
MRNSTPMAEEQTIGSILLADCGTVMTKVILLDQVNGQYRLVAQGEAPTTSEYPWGDVTEGIRHAIEQITEITGRTFLDGQGDIITPEQDARYGVDAFAATTSASPPLSVVLGGVTRDLSVASAERAVSGTYSHIKAILSAERREDAMSEEAFVRTIREARPDVICVAGGTDGGATVPVLNLVKSVAIACALMEEGIRPQVLYAGNVQLRQRIANLLKDRVTVRMADNVRPTLTEENLADAQAELNALYLQRKMSLLPGFDVLNSWVQLPIEPSATMFARLIRYLWHLGDPTRGVLGVDVGAANTTIVAVFNGRPYLTIQGGMGSAFGGKSLLRRRRGQPVVRWMPEDVDIEEAYGVLLNAEMRPATIQQDMRELRLAHSLARETLRAALAIARPG